MIRIGSIVRLKRGLRKKSLRKDEVARVESWIGDIEGGVRLDRPLDAFTYWNINDLELAPKRSAKFLKD